MWICEIETFGSDVGCGFVRTRTDQTLPSNKNPISNEIELSVRQNHRFKLEISNLIEFSKTNKQFSQASGNAFRLNVNIV